VLAVFDGDLDDFLLGEVDFFRGVVSGGGSVFGGFSMDSISTSALDIGDAEPLLELRLRDAFELLKLRALRLRDLFFLEAAARSLLGDFGAESAAGPFSPRGAADPPSP
jgi:hypothetical protein